MDILGTTKKTQSRKVKELNDRFWKEPDFDDLGQPGPKREKLTNNTIGHTLKM